VGEFPGIPFGTHEVDRLLLIDWSPAFRMLSKRHAGANSVSSAAHGAMAVHGAIARAAIEMIDYAIGRSTSRVIALSGGVFMNRILNELLVPELEGKGLTVLRHRQVPPGDGCIALGQAVVAGG
jgi:hydrogenase maturation protein HypF